jgi:hypothetical protein
MKRKGLSRFQTPLLLAVFALVAVGCAHEPELATTDTSGASNSAAETDSTAAASAAASADNSDAAALNQEAQTMLSTDSGETEKTADTVSAVSDSTAAAPAPDTSAATGATTDTAGSTAMAVVPSSEPTAPTVASVVPPTMTQAKATQVVEAKTPAGTPVVSKPKPKHLVAKSNLNRYYFLRNGDTPEFLSKLFYGAPTQAEKLVSWNKPREAWQPGKLIYYQSPVHPHDRKMLSFYGEKQLAAEEYVTKPGDSLAKIAEEKYGSSLSAREIAAVNNLHEGPLPLNKTLHLYPSMLAQDAAVKPQAPTAKSDAEMIRQEIDKVEKENAKTQAKDQPAVAAKGAANAPVAPVSPVVQQPSQVPVPAPVIPEQDKASLASMEVTSFVRQNPIAMAGAGALLILLGTYFVAARRRTRSRLDF